MNEDTGEVLDASKLLGMIDDAKLTEFNDLKAMGITIPNKLFSRGDLRAMKSSVKVF